MNFESQVWDKVWAIVHFSLKQGKGFHDRAAHPHPETQEHYVYPPPPKITGVEAEGYVTDVTQVAMYGVGERWLCCLEVIVVVVGGYDEQVPQTVWFDAVISQSYVARFSPVLPMYCAATVVRSISRARHIHLIQQGAVLWTRKTALDRRHCMRHTHRFAWLSHVIIGNVVPLPFR